ncbi:hypothetical protein [Borrelia sp. HM]|uniref:hypothetical protein n=1 Tax=Borrelia sp. HM TaxID=1882662 RepID=UPI001C7898BB|nr:hypothetical protein [Borrelia sp. HM]BCR21698.1 hypothetical protein BKFM_00264 [Borrelia sp. HM]
MEFLKGFLAIKLSDNEYFSILNLDDVAVKRVTLGKFEDETDVKLDFYISEYKDFSNPIFIGSFFLNNLIKESSSVNVYCRIASMVLYVYGECGGITNKSKFDLKSIKLSTSSSAKGLSGSLSSTKLDNLPNSLSDLELENENEVGKKSEGVLVQSQEDYLDELLDNVDHLREPQSLLMDENFSNNESNLNLSSNFLSSDNYKLSKEDLNSNSNLNLNSGNFDIGVGKDRFGTPIDKGSEIRHIINENNTVNKDTSDLGNISVNDNDVSTYSDDFDNLNVESIMTDLDKEFVESEFDSIDLDDFGDQDFTIDVEDSKSSLNLEEEEGLIQTSMLYLSLVSLFLLIFFSLFLIFSKVLNHRNFAISCFSFYKEEKIYKYEI